MRTTLEMPAVSSAELMDEMRGPIPTHEMRNWSESCDLAETQEMPAIEEDR